MDLALGSAYSRSWADQYVIADLGGRTTSEALAAGESPKHVWLAVWAVLELPLVDR